MTPDAGWSDPFSLTQVLPSNPIQVGPPFAYPVGMRTRLMILAALLIVAAAALMLLFGSDSELAELTLTAQSLNQKGAVPLSLDGSYGPLRVLTESTPELEAGFRTHPELELLPELLKEGRDAKVQVTVLGPDRRPQAGATVTLEPSPGSAATDQVLSDEQSTDAQGEVAFLVPRTGTYQVVASRGDLHSEVITDVRPGSRVVLLLKLGLPFAGQILDAESGGPVQGALLLLTSDTQALQATSGPEGRFELNLPSGANGRLEVLARGYARKKIWLDTQQGSIRLFLEVGQILRGSVHDSSGQPARDVTVRTLARRRIGSDALTIVLAESRTDALGQFSLGPTADDQVELEAESDPGDRVAMELDESAAHRDLKLILPDRHSLLGQIRLSDGLPAAGARIRLLGLGASEASLRRSVADGEGRFEIERIQTRKPYRLAVWHPDGTPVVLSQSATQSSEPLEIRLPKPNGIRGRVQRTDGTGAPFALLSVDHDDSGLIRAAGLREMIRADRDGRFRIRAVPPGTWRLSAVFEDQAVGPNTVQVLTGQETELVLELEGRVSLEGQLTDRLGRALASGSIEARLPNPRSLESQSGEQASSPALARSGVDAAGRFRVDLLPANRPVELVVTSAGYQEQSVHILRPEQSGPLVIRMTELLALTGQALDRISGVPLDRFSLTVSWTNGDGERNEAKRSFATADGSFRFEGLEPGTLELTVKGRGYFRFGPEELELSATTAPVLIRLDPAGQLDGRLLDDRGRPIPGTFVFLRETLPAQAEPELRRSRTRANGGFTLRELTPGRYELGVGQVEAPLTLVPVKVNFGRNVAKDIRLPQVGSVDLELMGPNGLRAGERVVRFVGQSLKARLDVVSDARGRASVGPLPADIYEVLCDGGRGSLEIRPGAVTPFRLSLPAEDGDE